MRITEKTAQELLEVLDEVRETDFRSRKNDYPYAEWERKHQMVKERLKNLPEYIAKAVECIATEEKGRGRPNKLELVKKVHLFLFARMLNKSNRGTEALLEYFQPLFGFDVSYKYIERLYSDEEVKLALHNLFVLLLKEENISGNLSGDGSGYSVKVETHYRTNPRKEGAGYLYFFSMIDLETNMYVGFGFSRVSEMNAFQKAVKMLEKYNTSVDSLSLDKYYASRKVLKLFDRNVSLFIIPKKNIAKIGFEWLRIFRKIAENPSSFLSHYFLRNRSESGFSADKGRFGSLIRQKREDRQEMALFSIALLHNLYAFRVR